MSLYKQKFILNLPLQNYQFRQNVKLIRIKLFKYENLIQNFDRFTGAFSCSLILHFRFPQSLETHLFLVLPTFFWILCLWLWFYMIFLHIMLAPS